MSSRRPIVASVIRSISAGCRYSSFPVQSGYALTFKKTFSEGDEFVDFGTDSIGFLSAYEAQSGLWPSLKKRRVGRLRTPFSVQKSFSSSTLYLPTIARPSYSLAKLVDYRSHCHAGAAPCGPRNRLLRVVLSR